MKQFGYSTGKVNMSIIVIVLLSVAFLAAAGFGLWAFVEYSTQKNNVDTIVERAVAEAQKEQAEKDEKNFRKLENQPYRQFVGPDDYGRVTFNYSKMWSVYEATDVSDGQGTYESYFSRIVVPPVKSNQQFALRVSIEEKLYDTVLRKYESAIKKGDLKSTQFTANGHSGTRLDGNFSKDRRGAAVVFKIRDKTLTISTDSDVFKPEFDELVKTIDFAE